MAAAVVHAAEDAGLRVPEDLSVVGFDDSPLSRRLRPALTTVHQDFDAKGKAAAAALTSSISRFRAGAPPGAGAAPHPRSTWWSATAPRRRRARDEHVSNGRTRDGERVRHAGRCDRQSVPRRYHATVPHSHAPDDLLRSTLAAVAPGGELRDGLERILRGRTGALIVLGFDQTVESICSGGFVLDVEFSATRLRELAKMDGAVVVDAGISRILRAAVQLLPDVTIETSESGTRHRTAERVAKQTGLPVISVSPSMRIIALYVGGQRHVLEDSDHHPVPRQPGPGHARAVQVAARRGQRHPVGARDRGPGHGARRVRRGAAPRDGPPHLRGDRAATSSSSAPTAGCCRCSSTSWSAASAPTASSIIRDYVDDQPPTRSDAVLDELAELDSTELLDLAHIARVLGLPGGGDALDAAVGPRGLPPAVQGPAPARRHRRPPGRALRRAAEAARRGHRRPHGGRRRRRAARPRGPRGPLPARGVQHPRALRLSAPGGDVSPSPNARRRRTRPAGEGRAARSRCRPSGAGRSGGQPSAERIRFHSNGRRVVPAARAEQQRAGLGARARCSPGSTRSRSCPDVTTISRCASPASTVHGSSPVLVTAR